MTWQISPQRVLMGPTCSNAERPRGLVGRAKPLGVSQLCKQSITCSGKWITTRHPRSCASGTERKLIPQTYWNGGNGAREERPRRCHGKASITIVDKVLLLDCEMVLRGAMFYCLWHQTPIWGEISPRTTPQSAKPLMIHYKMWT